MTGIEQRGSERRSWRSHCVQALSNIPVMAGLALSSLVHAATPASYLETQALQEYDVTPQGFTVECWIRVHSKPGFDPRVIRVVGPDPGPCEYVGGTCWEFSFCHLSDCVPGSLCFGVQTSGECHELFASGRVDDGRYHHIAGTYDGTYLRVYVDGALRGEKAAKGLVARVRGGKLVVGNSTDYHNPFDGEIDELRIWSAARSASEIQRGMSAEIKEIPQELVGYWPMNGDSEDRSRSKHSLIPHNYITFPPGKLGRAAAVMNVDVLRGELLHLGDERR